MPGLRICQGKHNQDIRYTAIGDEAFATVKDIFVSVQLGFGGNSSQVRSCPGFRKVITAAGDRINLVAGRETIQAFEVAYADFTELVYADGRRKAYLIPIIDHTSKLVLGWAVGERAVTSLALEAWERSRDTLRYQGVDLEQITIHHDQDPVFTGYVWTAQLLLKDHVRVSYALNGARDNPEMEAFNSRFKTKNRSLLLDALTLEELQILVSERMDYYNNERRHSSIAYQAPAVFIATLCHGRNITIPMG